MHPVHFGGTLSVQAHKVCVVYDRASGAIRHVHTSITLKGGDEPTQAEFEAAALRHAYQSGKQAGKQHQDFKLLQIAPSALQPQKRYAVDLQTAKLVEVPAAK
jgi:hypothetical protein